MRRSMLGASAAGVVLAASLGVPGAGAVAAPAPSLLPAGRAYQVTLLTGDVVTVRAKASGCPEVSVRPAAAGGVLHRSCGPDGHVRVVPAQVAAKLGKQLDPALFDVTALILDGYDDGRTRELPLIVRPGAGARQLSAGLAGARSLASIGAVAGRRAKTAGAALVGSASRIWLDRRVRATAVPEKGDANLRQVSAPRAWSAGYTGKGERVAVLDTGVDATHPDLAGRIAEKKDFTVDGGDAVDHFGHGTHVAATVAGSREGVAPGAELVVGKVLDDSGEGTDSAVIAGMEWAASRASVVNMSLGGWEPSDGTDPLSLAVDALTKQTGALFVTSAGNAGPGETTVSGPAAAASALTVGAVDGDDAVAGFSSRGPLPGTRAAKPELVAPGVDIVSARAAGTTLGRVVDARYTALSGTSMAAPHVAGAAAVLAQRHPDWKAAQLKAALIGSVDPVPGGDPYVSGAGRLDVARALSDVVSVTPLVNLGTLPFPQTGTAETKLAWSNGGSAPVTLTLGASASEVSLSDSQVRLAPGGTGEVTLRAGRTAAGFHSAVVTASAGGKVVTRTPVTFYVEPPSYDLTIETTRIPGTPDGGDPGFYTAHVVNLDDPAVFSDILSGEPGKPVVVRVPAGRYSALVSFMSWTDDDQRSALGGDPDLEITGDTTVGIDLSKAKRLTASVDGVSTSADAVGLTYVQTPRRGTGWSDFAYAWGEPAKQGNVFVMPMDGAGTGEFHAYAAFGLNAPGAYRYDLIKDFGNGIPAEPAYRVDAAEKAALAEIDQHFSTVDVPGGTSSHKRYGMGPDGEFLAESSTDGVSGNRTDFVSPGFSWIDEAFWNGTVTQEPMARYAPGSRQDKVWLRQPLRSDFYDATTASPSGCQPAAPSRTRGNLHVELVTLTDQHGRFDCLLDGWGLDAKRTLTLERDGQVIGSTGTAYADFAVPRKASTYRLTYDLDASASLPVSSRVTTSWTFRSAGPAGTGSIPLPLLAVDYALPLDAANHPTPSGTATFTVRQANGVKAQRITSFTVETSLDGGRTWQPATVRPGFRAQMPQPAAGQSVSLRVAARGSGGSGIEQTIIDAYRAG